MDASSCQVKPKTVVMVFVASLCQDITEIMLKVVLNTITLTLKLSYNVLGLEHKWHNTCGSVLLVEET
jgi:hypothetical protein